MKLKKTAYTLNQAKSYDSKRFDNIAGKIIHKMELSMLNFFLEFASTKKDILEVGCGTGRLLIELHKSG